MFRRPAVLFSAAAVTANPWQGGATGPFTSPEPVEEVSIRLKPSRSRRRKSSFYIPRMREPAPDAQAFSVPELGSAVPLFAITSSSCEYFALRLPLLKAGFKRLPLTGSDVVHTACNVVWGKSPRYARRPDSAEPTGHIVFTHSPALPPQGSLPAMGTGTIALNHPLQKFNHYPGSHRNLGCKQGMAKSIMHAEQVIRQRQRQRFGRRAEALVQEMFAFSPKTWFYPEHKEDMVKAFRASSPSSHFIWKPARGSCGRGILLSHGGAANERSWQRVMREIEERASGNEGYSRVYRHYVVQEYLDNPLLLEGRKTDLRLYVTVTSYNPLTVYLHTEGLVRLAAEPYHEGSPPTHDAADDSCTPQGEARQTPLESLLEGARSCAAGEVEAHKGLARNRFRYLTNFSVGRRHQAFRQQQGPQPTPQASVLPCGSASRCDPLSLGDAGAHTQPTAGPELKWSLERLWAYIDAWYPQPTAFFPASAVVQEKIALLITRTLLAARPNLCRAASRAETACGHFELYGFDVMLDARLDPFLIEVNTLPSLESSSDFDYATKCNVVSDMLNLAMIEPFARNPATLQPFTTNPALLQPPPASLKAFVHDEGEGGFSLSGLSRSEQREEIEAQLSDELLYARGFQRIFPPLRAAVAPKGGDGSFPLTCDSPRVQRELSLYTSFDLLTSLDEMALS